jgi:hypothetical protein
MVPHTFFAVPEAARPSTPAGIDVAVVVAISTIASADSDPHDPVLTLRLHTFMTLPLRRCSGE